MSKTVTQLQNYDITGETQWHHSNCSRYRRWGEVCVRLSVGELRKEPAINNTAGKTSLCSPMIKHAGRYWTNFPFWSAAYDLSQEQSQNELLSKQKAQRYFEWALPFTYQSLLHSHCANSSFFPCAFVALSVASLFLLQLSHCVNNNCCFAWMCV